MEQPTASPRLTSLLGFNAGYVDTAGFLALNGLFTAHVTGNFVTLAASLVHGTNGALAKLSALPVFCVLVVLSRLTRSVGGLMATKIVLLAAAAVLMIAYGPFPDSDAGPAFAAGMLLVAAMSVQNAVQRMYLTSAPPSTLMTGTTTQIMLDLADLLRGADSAARTAAWARLRKMVPAVLVFAAGCAAAALAYVWMGMWCFALPPAVAAMAAMAMDSGPCGA
ncbi:YoaK family protein [Bordetella sp. FB-8]|uniref:YoaK family protein n=1 Tax=Bordetella sp. FB-8 TaxID=1159870 RepID=UPI00039C7F20|nr:YoaK family protein [Bordetella sp. FB-8]